MKRRINRHNSTKKPGVPKVESGRHEVFSLPIANSPRMGHKETLQIRETPN